MLRQAAVNHSSWYKNMVHSALKNWIHPCCYEDRSKYPDRMSGQKRESVLYNPGHYDVQKIIEGMKAFKGRSAVKTYHLIGFWFRICDGF